MFLPFCYAFLPENVGKTIILHFHIQLSFFWRPGRDDDIICPMLLEGRPSATVYFTYILRCADGSLYTGITTDLERRFSQHSAGASRSGARYTTSRPPLKYECAFICSNRSEASRLEAKIKRLPRAKKLRLVAGENIPETESLPRAELDKEKP